MFNQRKYSQLLSESSLSLKVPEKLWFLRNVKLKKKNLQYSTILFHENPKSLLF